MAATPVLISPVLVSVDEYLRTSYRPDRDYIDGEVKERNLGEKPHSKVQALLIGYFLRHAAEWHIDPLPEQRVQVSATRFRIPDVCLVPPDSPDERIIRTPPILCIEILSSEDRMTKILERVDDYLRMGVPAVWIVDPWLREARSVSPDGTLTLERETLRVPNSPIHVPIPEIFPELAGQSPLHPAP